MAKFAVRARAVDMLGRQQIAGIPTAIHELFKNAHDAYASRVEVDYIRARNLLIVRDNGLGMTLDDFQNKWLALGTESKVGANQNPENIWTGPNNFSHRPILGEKGIGRLAIATIAPMTFVMSRAVRRDGLKDIVAALVNWELFEITGLNISDIEIALESFLELPTATDIENMRSKILLNARSILSLNFEKHKKILKDIEDFQLDPVAYDDWFKKINDSNSEDLSLKDNGYGTHFFLQPTDPILKADIEDKQVEFAPPIKYVLLGFSNSMQPGAEVPISAEFRDHKPSGLIDELIAGDQFFHEDDLKKMDHLFEGEFDEYGKFIGELNIYQGKSESYILNWPDSLGKLTECGPFKVRLAVIQGDKSETLLEPELHTEMMNKLRRYGGFYVYRDGIRMLPYGRIDFDWLGIENRRTLAAKDWFFSHRRMIGYVALDSKNNNQLIEKAGREGFRENKAFRQFKSILEHWLREIAKSYFREKADFGDDFRTKRDELQRKSELVKRQAKNQRTKIIEFKSKLNNFFESIDTNSIEKIIEEKKLKLETQLNALEKDSSENIYLEAERITADFLQTINEIENELTISPPRTFSLGQRDMDAYGIYRNKFNDIKLNQIEPVRVYASNMLNAIYSKYYKNINHYEKTAKLLEEEKSNAFKKIKKLKNETQKELKRTDREIKKIINSSVQQFNIKTEDLISKLGKENIENLNFEEAYLTQRKLETQISDHLAEQTDILHGILQQLQGLRLDFSERVTPQETIAALEGQVIELQSQLDIYNDLAQAGSALGIIGHELDNVVGGIRQALRELKPWADGTPGLKESYEKLRVNFDHIDGYLSLFAPLSRRVRRKKISISGRMIYRYIKDAFEDKLEANNILLKVTPEFEKYEMHSYASTLIATFVNLIDNAIYWISSEYKEEKWICLDADSMGFLISNNGPRIPIKIEKEIFKIGVSMKPGGRGLGLAISKDALEKVELSLILDNQGNKEQTLFRIIKIENDSQVGFDD